MKKVLTIAVASIAFAALADYSAPQIGVTKITTSSLNTIIPVPFYALSNGTSAVTAKDLVKTTGLADETWMLAYNGTSYSSWQLSSGVWTPALYANSALLPSTVTVTQGADETTLAAGGAIWIILPEATSTDIIVYGAYSESVSSTITAGKTLLVANPNQTTPKTPSISGMASGDAITVIGSGEATTYTYNGTAWGRLVKEGTSLPTFTPGLPSISASSGFWYSSKGASDVMISWQ